MEKAPEPSDAHLVAALQRGDWSAFDALYFRHKEWTYRLAWRFCADENEAQDVVQETFVYLASKLRDQTFTLRANLTTLLYPAVKHTALALKRKRRRMGAGLGRQEDEPLDIPVPATAGRGGSGGGHGGGDTEAAAVRRELAAVLRSLSDAHREVVLMRFVDDMTLEEIAAALAIPLGTAKSRLHHAIAAMRDDPQIRRYFSP